MHPLMGNSKSTDSLILYIFHDIASPICIRAIMLLNSLLNDDMALINNLGVFTPH